MDKRRAVFLDRDGVVNRLVMKKGGLAPPANVDEFEFLPGVVLSLEKLRKAGWQIVIVTNQPDITRGTLSMETLRAIHDKMSAIFRFDGIYVCSHDDKDRCDCRKPKPGLILQAAREHQIDPADSFMVGDRAKDIEAGRSAGCTTVLVQKPYSGTAAADHIVRDMPEAAEMILKNSGGTA